MRYVLFRLSGHKFLLIALALAMVLALTGTPAGLAKLRLNLDALCIARDTVAWQPGSSCPFQLNRFLANAELGPAATRLATALALNTNYRALAEAVAGLPLTAADVDAITATRLLLLRTQQGGQPPDLAAWRSAASSNVLEGAAAYFLAQGAPQDAATAKALAYALDAGWYDAWQRGTNARDLGFTELQAGRLDEAQAAYERSIASFGIADLPRGQEYAAYDYFRLAQIAEQRREVERALEYYRKGIWSSPEHSDFSRPVKLILATGDSMEEAYDYLAGVRKGGPQDNPALWSYSAEILAGLGARDMALRVLAETPQPLLDSPLIRDIESKLTDTNRG